jgi:hypothetical protein
MDKGRDLPQSAFILFRRRKEVTCRKVTVIALIDLCLRITCTRFLCGEPTVTLEGVHPLVLSSEVSARSHEYFPQADSPLTVPFGTNAQNRSYQL